MKKQKTLAGKAIRNIVVMAVVLVIASSISIYLQYTRSSKNRYTEFVYSYIDELRNYIDTDRIPGYIASGEPDAYYERVQAVMRAITYTDEVKYCYIFYPMEDGLYYVWDVYEDDSFALGYLEPYSDENGRKQAMEAFSEDAPRTIDFYRDENFGYVATGVAPLFDSAGNPVALVAIDVSMTDIQEDAVRFMISVATSIIVIMILSLAAYYFMIKKGIIGPIGQLNRAAGQMADNLEGTEGFKTDIRTGDEIEALAHAFEHMDQEIRSYIRELKSVTAEKERIGAELDLATRLQANMLPNIFPAFPEREEFDIYASMTPAKEVGGDFYDFFLIDEDTLGLVIADVSGKGVPAAMFMMMSKIIIANLAQMKLPPAQVLELANDRICAQNDEDMFVTVWLGIYTISTGHMVCASAGHEYPCIREDGGDFRLLKDKHGLAVGVLEGSTYQEYELVLDVGDTIFVYTDGVAEATSKEEELFGTDRTLKALNITPDAGPERLLKRVTGAVSTFVGDAPQFDDITMLSVKRLK